MASLFPKVSLLYSPLLFQACNVSSSICLYPPPCEESFDCLHFSVASSAGCSSLLPPPVGFQCLAVTGRVSQGSTYGPGGPRSGLPTSHSAGHPVRLWHCQGCQATGHHHHSWKETVTHPMHGWMAREGREKESMHGWAKRRGGGFWEADRGKIWSHDRPGDEGWGVN